MRNITLAVDDEVLAAVRKYAAERDATVNSLVREYLTNIAAQSSRATQARARLLQLSRKSNGQLGEKTWTRDDLHER